MNKTLGILVAAISIFAATDDTASAAFNTRHAGSECVPFFQGTTNYAYSNGRIGNTSATDNLRVICPVPRQGTTFSGAIIVSDNHSVQNVDCVLLGINPLANSTQITNTQVISSGDNGGTGNSSYFFPATLPNYFHAYLDCFIPPTEAGVRSYLVDYYITET